MPKQQTSHADVKDYLEKLSTAAEANGADLAHVAGSRAKLVGVIGEIKEISQQQASLTAGKQEATKKIRQLLAQGQRLATILRAAVKENYGTGAEKVAEFGLQPFRGRKAKAPKPVTPESAHPTEPTTAPAAPTNTHQ
jgi:hypothetical protein